MKVVIIGGGFGGLKLARSLTQQRNIDVLLIDKLNYHQFQPLFYQVATAGLDASNISFPLRKVFHGSPNIRIRLAEVNRIDVNEKQIFTTDGTFDFDVLVIASGAGTNFFGNANMVQYAFPMKTTVEALQLRNQFIEVLENCLMETDEKEIERLMTIVVVGGGPTGVEISGALAELKKFVLPKDYPELDFSKMKIILLEGSEKTLATMSAKSSRQSQDYLERLGVVVRLNSQVKDYDGKVVSMDSGEQIPSSTVIWSAGIKGNIPEGLDSQFIARGNRIKVNRFNQVLGIDYLYAIGDVAFMETPRFPNGHPQLANVAINQAVILSKNLIRISQKKRPLIEFEYADKGTMATVGRHLAVVDIPKPKLHFGGFLAWFIWMGLHLVLILGVKNRVQVFVNWFYMYMTYDQSLRLLFRGIDRRTQKGETVD